MENDVLYFIRIYITYNSRYIVGVDINDGKFPLAQQMGAHECVNSITCEGGDVKAWLMGKEKWGYDYTYDCTGNVNVMRCALEVAHRGWGESCVIERRRHRTHLQSHEISSTIGESKLAKT